MGIVTAVEKFFHMTDEVWERHANPWSCWTRFPCLPAFSIAIWSRVWLGWLSLAPVFVVCLWTWLNPRVFGKPRSTDHWASRAVLGERVWLKHPKSEIPIHHLKALRIIQIIILIGSIQIVYGLVALHLWLLILGNVIIILGKMWFLDRMVWLYQDLREEKEEYQSWLY